MSVEQSGASDQDGPGDEGPTIPGNGEKQFVTRTIGPSEATPGTVIGSYRLLQLIGQGGMGEVWLAEQKQPVRRRVAIKLIKAGMDTREVVARFESEAALSRPSHDTQVGPIARNRCGNLTRTIRTLIVHHDHFVIVAGGRIQTRP